MSWIRAMKRGLRPVAALGVFVAVGFASWSAPAAASPGIEAARFDGGHGGHGFGGFHGGGFHGGGYRGPGFYRYGYGYGPGFAGNSGYGFRRRRIWCYYHPGACYPYPWRAEWRISGAITPTMPGTSHSASKVGLRPNPPKAWGLWKPFS